MASLTVEIKTVARYTPGAIRAVWAERDELWEQWRPQLAALEWTGLGDDGPPMPPSASGADIPESSE